MVVTAPRRTAGLCSGLLTFEHSWLGRAALRLPSGLPHRDPGIRSRCQARGTAASRGVHRVAAVRDASGREQPHRSTRG